MLFNKQFSAKTCALDFKSKVIDRVSQKDMLVLDDINALFKNGAVDEAINYIDESIVAPAADFYYEKATEYFYKKDYASAEKIYLKLAALESSETAFVADKSEFDLYVLYLNTGEYEKSINFKKQGNGIPFSPMMFIKSLLKLNCKYRYAQSILKNKLKFTIEEMKSIYSVASDIQLRREKAYLEDGVSYDVTYGALSYKEYSEFSKALSKSNIDFSKENTRKLINEYYLIIHEFNSYRNLLLEQGSLETKFILNMPKDNVDYMKLEDVYVEHVKNFIREKIKELRAQKTYDTLKDTLMAKEKALNQNLYDNVSYTMNVSSASDSEIAYAIFKNCLFFMASLTGIAAFSLIEDKSIIHPNILKKAIFSLSLINSRSEVSREIFELYVQNNPKNFTRKIEYALYLILFKDDFSQAINMLKDILVNKQELSEFDKVLGRLGFRHALYLANYLSADKITQEHKDDLILAIELLMQEYNKKTGPIKYNLHYNQGLSVKENMAVFSREIGVHAMLDVRFLFLEFVSEIF